RQCSRRCGRQSWSPTIARTESDNLPVGLPSRDGQPERRPACYPSAVAAPRPPSDRLLNSLSGPPGEGVHHTPPNPGRPYCLLEQTPDRPNCLEPAAGMPPTLSTVLTLRPTR